MDKRRKSKTFGLRTPTDLHGKLLFDIQRLRFAGSTKEARYAAFDCAVDAWHLVDWTLHAVDDDAHERLTGRNRPGLPKNSRLTVESAFAEMQKDRLPGLAPCQNLANSAKHSELRNDLMPKLWSGSNARFLWSEPSSDGERSISSVSLSTYIEFEDERYDACGFFKEVAQHWQEFLTEEGLFHPAPDFPDD